MSLSERIQRDLTEAMKSKDAPRVGVLRMIKSALTNREIEKRAALSESEETQVLKSLAKQRAEAAEQFEAGGRHDLAEKERREQALVESYLPEPLTEEEMEHAADAVIEERKAAGPRDMGAVMKEVMARLEKIGKMVDGKRVSSMVRAKLDKLAKRSS